MVEANEKNVNVKDSYDDVVAITKKDWVENEERHNIFVFVLKKVDIAVIKLVCILITTPYDDLHHIVYMAILLMH